MCGAQKKKKRQKQSKANHLDACQCEEPLPNDLKASDWVDWVSTGIQPPFLWMAARGYTRVTYCHKVMCTCMHRMYEAEEKCLTSVWGNKGKSLNARKNSFINFWSAVSGSKTALNISHPYYSTRCFFIRTIPSQIKQCLDWVGKTAAEINRDNCGERVLLFFKQ